MLDTPTHISDEEIVTIITKGITDGKAQSACIWAIIGMEKGVYPINDTPQIRKEWNDRYREISGFITKKGLRVPEKSPLIEGFRRDISRLLKSA